MKRFSVLLVATLDSSSVLVTALPRGSSGGKNSNGGGGIRRSQRSLQKDNMGGGGGGGAAGVQGNGLIEIHTCEPDPQEARDYVDLVGYPEQGDMDCYADPVNACPGGCCRFATYFICDTDNFAPHLACVCNANTAPLPPPVAPPTPPPVPVTPAPVPVATPATTPPVADAGGGTAGTGTLDIVDTAIGAGSFQTLTTLLTTAGLVDDLRTPGPFTVFAPSDAAFQELADAGGLDGLDTDMEALTSVLLYHVVPGEILASDLTEGATVTTLQGDTLVISLDPVPTVNGIEIIQTDIDATNGVIHVIDGILIPGAAPPATPGGTDAGTDGAGTGGTGGTLDIVDTAIGAGSFETLTSLLTTTGLADDLRTPGQYTVFAPNDAAFQALAAEGGGVFDGLDDINVLTSVLTYHVIPGEFLASDLEEGATLTTVQGTNVTISLDPAPTVNGINIIQTDIAASNGVIHVIDGILIPPL